MSASLRQDFSTAESAACYQRSMQSLAMGVSSGLRRSVGPIPLFYERADGPYFFDVDGHRLLDYTLGWGPLILGNNHPVLNKAVTQQLSRGYAFGAQHRAEIELAELLVRVLPGVERVILSNTGTEAVQAALRLARAYTGRNKVIKFEGHYHGWLNNVLVSYRLKPDDPCISQPTCGGQPASEYADTLVLPWNDLPALEHALECQSQQVACVIMEPILANGGGCMPDADYLEKVIQLCRRHGVISIFDEVITGFRVALGGAREYFGVEPDLSVYAKALAAGFVISAVGGREDIFRVLEDGRTIHAGTYNGNPINIAAAIATIQVLSEPGTFNRMHTHGVRLRSFIEQRARACDLPLATSGTGSVFSVHFGLSHSPRNYRDTLGSDMAIYNRFRMAMLRNGVQLLADGRWYVGATHTDQELELAIAAIERSFDEVTK